MNELYLSLMKKCLTNQIYWDKELIRCTFPGDSFIEKITGRKLVKNQSQSLDDRLQGRDWSPVAHTMIGIKRLNNIQLCIENIIRDNIPGDFIETGVWRGGATIFMRAVLKSFNITDRKIWVADSFEGLPKPECRQDTGDKLHTFRELAISLDDVKRNFQAYDLLDDQVCFLKGWFKDTLPAAPVNQLALVRLDGDMYGSTMDALENLYHKLSVGGYLIVDDYGVMPTCRQAVSDFRKCEGIKEEIVRIDHSGVFWRKIDS